MLFGTHHGFWKGWYRTVLQGLRDGERVLHWAPVAGDWWESEPTPGGEWQLLDASEASDLTDAEPDRADAMRAELERILVEAAKQRVAPSFGGGETTREMLEGIGYLESGDDEDPDSEE